jgi:YD repeat-containing protein
MQKTAAGTVTMGSYTYNAQHLPLTTTDAAGQTTTYTYNAAGQVTTITDPLGHVTTYSYNSLGYLVSVVNALGKTQMSMTYDSFGRVATRTDSEGLTARRGPIPSASWTSPRSKIGRGGPPPTPTMRCAN